MKETNMQFIRGGSFLTEDILPKDMTTPEDFTEEHRMIAKTTERFVDHKVVPLLEELEQQDFKHSLSLLREAGELGLLSADIPEQYGGLSLDAISASLIAEKFSKAGGFSVTHGAHVGIGTLPIVFFGSEAQKETYLPKLATGEWIAAYALTEPSSGSDALGAKATATLNGSGTHYILTGEKQWITNAAFADVFIVYAKVDGKDFSAFIVERDFPGVSVGPEEKKMGIKSSSTRTLILEDVHVPVENLLGERGRGHIIAFNILNVGRYKLAIGSIGAAKRALELSVQYVKERKQFNQPIAAFTLTQEKIATMASELYAHESAVYRTVGLFKSRMDALNVGEADGRDFARAIAEYQMECSIHKYMCTEMLDYVVDEAVQLHGGYGFMYEYEVERMYRDSRINRIFEGTNEINRLLVPGALLKKALKGELPLLEKALDLQQQLMTMFPEEVGEEPLAQEKHLVSQAKKIAILMCGLAAQTYMQQLEDEQEILVRLSNIIGLVYHMESALLRAEKALDRDSSDLKQRLTEVYVQEAIELIISYAKDIIITIQSGDEKRMSLAALRKLTRYNPHPLIYKKRAIAQIVLENGHYVV